MTILILRTSWCGEIAPSGRTPLVSRPTTFTLKKNLDSSLKFTEDAPPLSCRTPLVLIWIMMMVWLKFLPSMTTRMAHFWATCFYVMKNRISGYFSKLCKKVGQIFFRNSLPLVTQLVWSLINWDCATNTTGSKLFHLYSQHSFLTP